MVIKNENSDKLFSYRKYGFGKVGYVDYEFSVNNSYEAQIIISISKETTAQAFSSQKVKLNEGEIEILDLFIKNNILPQKNNISSFDSDIDTKYENFSISTHGVTIIEDEDLKAKFENLYEFFEMNHAELSRDLLASMYEKMETDLYHEDGVKGKR